MINLGCLALCLLEEVSIIQHLVNTTHFLEVSENVKVSLSSEEN